MTACSCGPRSGGVLVLFLVVVLAIICLALYSRVKNAEARAGRPEHEATEAPSPFRDTDAILADDGPASRSDTRSKDAEKILERMKLERKTVDAAAREALADVKARENDIARIRKDIIAVSNRIDSLTKDYRKDPSDEKVAEKLDAALIKLEGEKDGTGAVVVEGLETRLVRAVAALRDAEDRAAALNRRLASLDSSIAKADLQKESVGGVVRFEEANRATDEARKAGKAMDGLDESTEATSIGVSSEGEAARARRSSRIDAHLHKGEKNP